MEPGCGSRSPVAVERVGPLRSLSRCLECEGRRGPVGRSRELRVCYPFPYSSVERYLRPLSTARVATVADAGRVRARRFLRHPAPVAGQNRQLGPERGAGPGFEDANAQRQEWDRANFEAFQIHRLSPSQSVVHRRLRMTDTVYVGTERSVHVVDAG